TMVRRHAGSIPGPNALGPTDPGAPAPLPGFTAGVFTTADGKHCPPEGDGGDPALNRLKNRDQPPPTCGGMTGDAFLEEAAADASDMGRTKRAKWTPEALAEVAALESK